MQKNIPKNSVILILYCLLISSSVFAEIRTIHSLDEISIDELSKNTLVMLDIDDVLIYPKDALLQNYRDAWKPAGVRAWTAEEDTIAWMSETFQLMDPSGPKFIDTLSANNIPVIGFTAFAMDQSGIVESIPAWRHKVV